MAILKNRKRSGKGARGKAREQGWCQRCRGPIYPGEWVLFGTMWDRHLYACPDPDEAAEAYALRLAALREKRRAKRRVV